MNFKVNLFFHLYETHITPLGIPIPASRYHGCTMSTAMVDTMAVLIVYHQLVSSLASGVTTFAAKGCCLQKIIEKKPCLNSESN